MKKPSQEKKPLTQGPHHCAQPKHIKPILQIPPEAIYLRPYFPGEFTL